MNVRVWCQKTCCRFTFFTNWTFLLFGLWSVLGIALTGHSIQVFLRSIIILLSWPSQKKSAVHVFRGHSASIKWRWQILCFTQSKLLRSTIKQREVHIEESDNLTSGDDLLDLPFTMRQKQSKVHDHEPWNSEAKIFQGRQLPAKLTPLLIAGSQPSSQSSLSM